MALFSDEYPKPLLPICNKPIMQYQIEIMRDLGITDIVIVVGHLKSRIIERFRTGEDLGAPSRARGPPSAPWGRRQPDQPRHSVRPCGKGVLGAVLVATHIILGIAEAL